MSLTPATTGPHSVYVESVDRAGNVSAVTTYSFNVGTGTAGAITSPHSGDVTGTTVALTGAVSSGTGVTYQWRRSPTDSWTNVPVGDVTLTSNGGAVSAWPLALTGTAPDLAPTPLTWNVTSTLAAADAGTPLAGPVQIQAVFAGSGTSTTVEFTYDQNLSEAPTSQEGPGNVNLVTGDFSVSADDATDSSEVALSRTYDTRQSTRMDPMFGPGWVSSLSAPAAAYTGLTKTGTLVQLGLPDGSVLGFNQTSTNGTGAVYAPPVGAADNQLVYTTSGDFFTLTDPSQNVTTFTHPSGAAAGFYSPSASTSAGSTETVTYSWQSAAAGIQPTRILEPVPAGISCTTMVEGCRSLFFTYATSTTATGTTQATWGDYTGRLKSVSLTAWDPVTAAMKTVVLSQYDYDSNGRLTAQWDPRIDNGATHLWTTYAYDSNGILNTIAPVGTQPWTLAYTTIPGDSGLGRLATVSQSALSAGTATTAIVYNVPVSGAGAPYDMSVAQTSRWGEMTAPVAATAVFGPDYPPGGNQATGTMPSSFVGADITYLDSSVRPVNTVDGNGDIDTTWYDTYGNVTKTLFSDDRLIALNASATDTPAQEAAIADRESTSATFTADGAAVTDTYGPEHDVQLNSGAVVRGRTHTHTTYDQGAPTGGPFYMPTTVTSTTRWYDGNGVAHDDDPYTTSYTYDWTTLQQLSMSIDPSGLDLTTSQTYDPLTGKVSSVTKPGGNAPGGSNTYTTLYIYYTAAANATFTSCGGHPEWEGQLCRLSPHFQPTTGPQILPTVTTYNLYNEPWTYIEKLPSNAQQRVTTYTYDSAGRVLTTVVTQPSGGIGTDVPTIRAVYDPTTGRQTATQSLDASNNVTAQIQIGYDALGRVDSYTDADGNATTTTYDLESRVATVNDGQATRTYTYDGASEHRGLATSMVDSQAGTFTASYDSDGYPVAQTWPDSINVAATYNEVGRNMSLTYTQPGCGQPDCTLYAQSETESSQAAVATSTSTLAQETYGYDNSGRLTSVGDTVDGQCTTRQYTFNVSTDRTGVSAFAPNPDGSCQTATASTTSTWAYDGADRLTSTGYTYDTMGRLTTIPATDTETPSAGSETIGYYTNDMVQSLTQGSRTATYTLDPDLNRIRTSVDSSTGLTTTNHYGNESDIPVWSSSSAGVTRPLMAIGAFAGIASPSGISWQISDMAGNLVASVAQTGVGLASTTEYTEYGVPENPASAGTVEYGWEGSALRAANTPGGLQLMGVRLYDPVTGRFLSLDSDPDGNANGYDYCWADPVNCSDLSGSHSNHSDGSSVHNEASGSAYVHPHITTWTSSFLGLGSHVSWVYTLTIHYSWKNWALLRTVSRSGALTEGDGDYKLETNYIEPVEYGHYAYMGGHTCYSWEQTCPSTTGAEIQAFPEVELCVFHVGCIESWYAYMRIYVIADGSHSWYWDVPNW